MKILKLLARIVVALVALVIVAILTLWYVGRSKVDGRVQRRVPAFAAATDSSSLERGRHLASISCAACHSSTMDVPLAAPDTAFIKSAMFATLQPSNLTPGGVLASYSDGQLARAIREGVNRDDHAMMIMPSQAFHTMSDRDLAALMGYLRTQPAVVKPTQPRAIGPIAGILLALGAFPTSLQPPVDSPIADVPAGATAEYGGYLAPIFGCKECHGHNLRGIKPGDGPPPGPDIVAVAQQHPIEKFELALRHGVGTSGKQLSVEMPWAIFARLTDTEVEALYQYVKNLP